jgi:uncharacterized membrane protein YgdD (TMEM256/DUF423 family)
MNWNRFFESGAAARLSAAWAGMAVALGAFGAHGLKPVLLQRPDGMETWRTAVLYHLVHAVVMMVLALQAKRANRAAWLLMFLGTVAFSASLYLLSTTGWKVLGPITPLGGLLLLAGWVSLVAKPWRISA